MAAASSSLCAASPNPTEVVTTSCPVRHERDSQRRIDSTGEKRAQRDFTLEALVDRVTHQVLEIAHDLVGAPAVVVEALDVPVFPRRDHAVVHPEPVPGLEFLHVP